MKYLFAILISLVPGTISAAAERIYSTGCIPSTPKDWERAGVPLRSSSEELRLGRVTQLSCGSTALLSKRLTDSKPILPRYEIPTMSDVKNQSQLGTCSIFAIVAAIEAQLPKGTIISEAELFMRLKCVQFDVNRPYGIRKQRGANLASYALSLRHGVVLDEQFIDYNAFVDYVLNVVKDEAAITVSVNYQESIMHLQEDMQRKGITVRNFRPIWTQAGFEEHFPFCRGSFMIVENSPRTLGD
jgi:hypothetical protein